MHFILLFVSNCQGSNKYGGADFYHHGWYNARHVLGWVKETFPNAERFYVHGCNYIKNHATKHIQN